jgi:membrane-bound lytic murein transglycosylase B
MAPAQSQPNRSNPFAGLDAQLSDAAYRTLAGVVRPKAGAVARSAKAPMMVTRAAHQSALQRVQQLRPVLEPILREAGVPTELAAVVLVESGGEPAALSGKGARGLWQMMPETARRYGLVVNADQDDRLDVLKSTRGAAEYLRDLYARFHDWQLALAAYNAGEQAVQRAVVRTGARAFSAAGQALPQETRNYVPAVLNAMGWFGELTPVPLTKYAPSDRVVYATSRQ